MLFDCPTYNSERAMFFRALRPQTLLAMLQGQTQSASIMAMLSSSSPNDWIALGQFLARLRQRRRKLRQKLASLQARWDRSNYHFQKWVWRASGGSVCRHGVFFSHGWVGLCRCMQDPPADDPIWTKASFMPKLSLDLKGLVKAKFQHASYRRLGQCCAELKRRGW